MLSSPQQYGTVLASTALTTVLTCADDQGMIIKTISVTNTGAGALTIDIAVYNAITATDVYITHNLSIAAHANFYVPFLVVLNPGDKLKFKASGANDLHVYTCGVNC